MPDSLMVKLKWYTRSVFTLSSDQVEQAVQFRSNDIYLPTATATTRAMGFQEYITLYDRWIVHASRIVVKIFQVAVGASANVSEWILYPSNDTTTEAIEVARQYPYSKTTICGIQSSGAAVRTLSSFMSFKKAEGRANYDLNYAGTETASPTAVRYWNLQAQQLAGGAADLTMNADVTITYFVRFFSREDPVNTEIPALEQEANIAAYNALKNGSQPVSN